MRLIEDEKIEALEKMFFDAKKEVEQNYSHILMIIESIEKVFDKTKEEIKQNPSHIDLDYFLQNEEKVGIDLQLEAITLLEENLLPTIEKIRKNIKKSALMEV